MCPLMHLFSLIRTFYHATSQLILGIHLVLQASMQQVVVDCYNRETGIDVDGPALVENTWFVFFYC